MNELERCQRADQFGMEMFEHLSQMIDYGYERPALKAASDLIWNMVTSVYDRGDEVYKDKAYRTIAAKHLEDLQYHADLGDDINDETYSPSDKRHWAAAIYCKAEALMRGPDDE